MTAPAGGADRPADRRAVRPAGVEWKTGDRVLTAPDVSLMLTADSWRRIHRDFRAGDPRKGTASAMAAERLWPVVLVRSFPPDLKNCRPLLTITGPAGVVQVALTLSYMGLTSGQPVVTFYPVSGSAAAEYPAEREGYWDLRTIGGAVGLARALAAGERK